MKHPFLTGRSIPGMKSFKASHTRRWIGSVFVVCLSVISWFPDRLLYDYDSLLFPFQLRLLPWSGLKARRIARRWARAFKQVPLNWNSEITKWNESQHVRFIRPFLELSEIPVYCMFAAIFRWDLWRIWRILVFIFILVRPPLSRLFSDPETTLRLGLEGSSMWNPWRSVYSDDAYLVIVRDHNIINRVFCDSCLKTNISMFVKQHLRCMALFRLKAAKWAHSSPPAWSPEKKNRRRNRRHIVMLKALEPSVPMCWSHSSCPWHLLAT